MPEADVFIEHRPLLFSIAYRMLGSVADAEDAVQETFIRWQAADQTAVESPRSYLSAIVTRLAIDQLRSARTTREVYTGPWLPEPMLTEQPPDRVELAESLSMAVLLLLERLSPAERAAYLLREVFDYEYAEIASIIDSNEATCRQWVKRAKDHLAGRRARYAAGTAEHKRVLSRFVAACQNGDVDSLAAMLAEDAITYSDGGGKRRAAINPIHGALNNARFFVGIAPKVPTGFSGRFAVVNGEPALLGLVDGALYSVMIFNFAEEKLKTVYIVVNPDKLAGLAEQLGVDLAALE